MNEMQMRPCGNGYMYCYFICGKCRRVNQNTTNASDTAEKKYGLQTTHSIAQMPTTTTT